MYVFGEIIVGEAENTFLVKRNLIDENQMYVIVGNKLVSKKIEIVKCRRKMLSSFKKQ